MRPASPALPSEIMGANETINFLHENFIVAAASWTVDG